MFEWRRHYSPALAGEEIEYESIPEPGMAATLVLLGVSAVGMKVVH